MYISQQSRKEKEAKWSPPPHSHQPAIYYASADPVDWTSSRLCSRKSRSCLANWIREIGSPIEKEEVPIHCFHHRPDLLLLLFRAAGMKQMGNYYNFRNEKQRLRERSKQIWVQSHQLVDMLFAEMKVPTWSSRPWPSSIPPYDKTGEPYLTSGKSDKIAKVQPHLARKVRKLIFPNRRPFHFDKFNPG